MSFRRGCPQRNLAPVRSFHFAGAALMVVVVVQLLLAAEAAAPRYWMAWPHYRHAPLEKRA